MMNQTGQPVMAPQGQIMMDAMGQPRRDASGVQMLAYPLLDYHGTQCMFKGQALWRNPVLDANGIMMKDP